MEEEQPKSRQIPRGVLAVILWILTFGLGLESIYVLKEMFLLIFVALGGSAVEAERFALGLICVLSVGALVFVIGTLEYHRKHFDTPESWRLFSRTLAVELSIIVLYYILL